MSRSGYSDDYGEEFNNQLFFYRQAVDLATEGRRGQQFFRALLAALDAMSVKELIAGELELDGRVCALGCLGQALQMDISELDVQDHKALGRVFKIAPCLTAEVMYMNDEANDRPETPAERWQRVRAWVAKQVMVAP